MKDLKFEIFYYMENLNAAIPSINTPGNLSSQEFQNMLTSWFEEKGIVSDLRSHLRFKMVNVLKNTAIGRDITKKASQHNSLSKQAINLIVAEFLMRNSCHYSLSIFNTEAALTNIFPEYPLFDNSKEPFRYDCENILNILELIGISKSSEFSKDVLNLYFQSQENCILSCLVILLCKLATGKLKQPPDENIVQMDLASGTNFVKQVGNLLLQSNLSSENIIHIMKNIDSFHNIELKDMEDKYSLLINELRCEVSGQETKIKELTRMKKLVENKLIKVVGDYNALKNHMKKMVKEKLLRESKELQIKKHEKSAKLVEHSVSEPLLQKTITIACSRQHCEEKCQENANLLNKLQIENQQLQRKNKDQSEEYSVLSRKYNDILQDFRDYQKKIILLNSRLNGENITPVFNIPMIDDHQKASEGMCPLPTFGKQKNIPLSAHLRNSFDISESSESVTEEILREARLRLKQLEDESKNIEENYRDIQQGLSCMKL